MAPVRALSATLILASLWESVFAIHVTNTSRTSAAATTMTSTLDPSIATTGSGSSYASHCLALSSSYNSGLSSWISRNETTSVMTQVYGGYTGTTVTSYRDEQPTLCDGHPRLLHSPAVPILTTVLDITKPATSTTTYSQSGFDNYPGPSPSCNVLPSDCDVFWNAYSSSLSSLQSAIPSGTGTAPQITSPPQPPTCWNSSAASSYSAVEASVHGCGPCTIFGQGVELVYFPVPTTVSRDMCASTPSAHLTHYGPGAVIEAYAGKSYGANATLTPGGTAVTAVADGHTFTSGTAYISISSVWAENRCSQTLGTPVMDAILAMPSESVLSLRYSQNHFQYFFITKTQTGYPVSYADFNQPIPYSAWRGQAMCEELAQYECQIIYENDYRPQLAIPPQITMLNSAWEGCQLWYGGLYDPPRALTATALVVPTAPSGYIAPASTPSPSVAATVATQTYSAIADNIPSTTAASSQAASPASAPAGQTASAQDAPSSATTGYIAYGTVPSTGNSGTSETSGGMGSLIYGGLSGGSGSGESSEAGGGSGSSGNSGSSAGGSGSNENSGTTAGGSNSDNGSGSDDTSAGSTIVKAAHSNVFAINDQTYTAVVTKNVVSVCSTIITSGATAQTLPGGLVASYGSQGLNIQSSRTLTIAHQTSRAAGAVAGTSTPFDTTLTIAGQTIVVSECPTPSGAIAVGSATLVLGGPATTLADGEVISRASDGLVFSLSTSVALEQTEENESAASGATNAAATATASTDSSGQSADGGSRVSANSFASKTSVTGNDRNSASSISIQRTSTSIQRTTPTSKSAGSHNILSLGSLLLPLVALSLAIG